MRIQTDNIRIIRLHAGNFREDSLDAFILRQRVTRCWRKCAGTYILQPVQYVEEWDMSARRDRARKILDALGGGAIAFGAVAADTVIGYALVGNELFGSGRQYADLADFYVSEPFRRRGIGKRLFGAICEAAKTAGARKLYVSAHSAEESIAAYTKYGCVLAEEPDAAHAEKEPYDLQLEYDLYVRVYEAAKKEAYWPLLLSADEQKDMVERYLYRGTMFVLDDGGVRGEIVVTDEGNGVLGIKNLAVLPEFQHRGYGRKLIEFVCMRYRGAFSVIQAGTGDSPLTRPFYEKCGFTISHTVKDFFTDNYDHPVIEAGIQLKDMIYLKKKL